MWNPPSWAPVFAMCLQSVVTAQLAMVLLICLAVGSATAQSFICHAEPDSVDVVQAAGGQAPYLSGALVPALRFSVHVMRDDYGAGGYQAGDIDSMLARMVSEFEEVSIQLIEVSRSEVLDSAFLSDPINSAAAMFSAQADSSSLNVFLGSPAGTIEGMASGIPGRSLLLTGNAVGTSALSHFMGHCLGLYETDETEFGIELPDGSNSDVAGDLVTDTPAAAPMANILEGEQVANWEEFTSEQGARMRTAIALAEVLWPSNYYAGVEYRNASNLTGLVYDGVPENATAVDFAGDGRLDLVVTANNSLFQTNSLDATYGVPAFDDVTPNRGIDQNTINMISTSSGVTAADYDNDGDLDLYFPRPSGHLLLRNQGTTFADLTALVDEDIQSLTGAWGDYDADGLIDLVVVLRSSIEEWSSGLALFHNNAGTSFSIDNSKGISGTHTQLRSVLWGDLNRDQRLDLVAVQTGPYLPYYPDLPPQPEGTHSQYWLQQPDGSFVQQGLGHDDHLLQYRSCQAVLMDAEPDGDLDLAYTNVAGAGYFANGWDPALSLTAAPLDSARAIFYRIDCQPHGGCPENAYRNMIDMDLCDFNLDGKPDYVAIDPNMYPYATLAIHDDGELPQYTSTLKEVHEWYADERISGGAAVADFDENGSQDIYVARDVGTSDFFYRPEKSPYGDFGNWVGLKLRSYDPGCNRYAIGATVVLSHGTGTTRYEQAQTVDGGSGRAGQSPLNLVFGLGTRSGTVDVSVYWPDGQTLQTYTDLPIGQYHTLQIGILPSTTTFTRTFDPGTGLYTWEFRWNTGTETPKADDRVVITPHPDYPNCGAAPITLVDNPPFVTADVTLVGGQYLHTMTWNGVDCTAPCRFTYTVSSRFGGVTWTLAADKEFKTLYCASAP